MPVDQEIHNDRFRTKLIFSAIPSLLEHTPMRLTTLSCFSTNLRWISSSSIMSCNTTCVPKKNLKVWDAINFDKFSRFAYLERLGCLKRFTYNIFCSKRIILLILLTVKFLEMKSQVNNVVNNLRTFRTFQLWKLSNPDMGTLTNYAKQYCWDWIENYNNPKHCGQHNFFWACLKLRICLFFPLLVISNWVIIVNAR